MCFTKKNEPRSPQEINPSKFFSTLLHYHISKNIKSKSDSTSEIPLENYYPFIINFFFSDENWISFFLSSLS